MVVIEFVFITKMGVIGDFTASKNGNLVVNASMISSIFISLEFDGCGAIPQPPQVVSIYFLGSLRNFFKHVKLN